MRDNISTSHPKLQKLSELFLEKNRCINLSAIRDAKGVEVWHIEDSLKPWSHLDAPIFEDGDKVLDLGIGGGFPILPLAIMHPHTQFVGVDSVQKKVVACQEFAKTLDLCNTDFMADRIETLGQNPEHREAYDFVVSRALAKFPTMLEYTVPLVLPGGFVGSYLGPSALEEKQRYKDIMGMLGVQEQACIGYELFDGDKTATHYLLVMRKIKETPSKYPREMGMPKKFPLGKDEIA